MKNKLLAILAVGLLTGPMGVEADMVPYNATYTASLGPSGVGSFYWDADTGVITDFFWNFGGGAFVGGMGDYFDNSSVFDGGTLGQFVFEIISELDVYPSFDCTNDCGAGATVQRGAGALNGTFFSVFGGFLSPGGGFYNFYSGPTEVARGIVTVLRVPEPGTLVLFGLGLLGLGFSKRRKHD